jgi:hypothetical protein
VLLPHGWPRGAVTVAALPWLGLILWRYQEVSSPQPMFAVLLAAAVAISFALAAFGAGLPVWRWAGGRADPVAGGLVIVLASGAGVLMACTAALSLLGVLRPPLVATIALVAVAAGTYQTILLAPRFRFARAAALLVPASVVIAAILVTLPKAAVLAPFYDQFNYHLAFPFQWLRAGRIVVFERHSYSFLAANMGLLYTYPLATVGAWGGQVVHWCMGALAVAGAAQLAHKLGGPRAGFWAAAILAATPAVMTPATWAGADLGVAALAAAAWLAVLDPPPDGVGTKAARWWLLAGALAGLAAGCKYLALAMVAVPVFIAVVLVQRGASAKRRWGRVGLWLAGAALAFSPWLVRNLVATGNPLFPFFNSWFPPVVLLESQGAAEMSKAAAVAEFPAHRLETRDRLTLGTFRPQGDAGAIGPLYLGLAPLAFWIAVRDRRRGAGIVLMGVLLGVVGWWWAPQLGRYLVPVLVLLAALLGAACARILRIWPRSSRRLVTVLLAGVLFWNVSSVLGDGFDRLSCLVGRSRFEDLMRTNVTYWPAIAFINEKLPADAKVLLVAESRTLFLERDTVVEDPFRTPRIVELADTLPSAAAMLGRLRAAGITHLLYNVAEARRIAEMTHRESYLAPATPQGEANLKAFFSSCLAPAFSDGPVAVMQLLPAQR